MITTIIIDDEQHCIDRLTNLLKENYSNSINLLGAFNNIGDGLKAINNLQPQLVFLDVQIHEKTGFDLLQQISNIDFDVIFTTAYEKYAVQAFKFSAIDYLLKPIAADDLDQAVNKLKVKFSKDDVSLKLDSLFHNLKNMQGASKKICVPVVTGIVFLDIADIIRCESDVNYTTIFLKDKQKLVVAKTLKEFEEMLVEYNFFRVHNSHLVNLAYIKSFNKGKGGFVTLADNTSIEVSTRRKDDFLKAIEREYR
jgi:two-component system, LytTR family, response regulator